MTDPKDPPRWTESGSSAPEGLREVLKSAVQDVGSEPQLARLAERLAPMLAPPGAALAPPAATAGVGLGMKLGLAAVGMLAAGGSFLLLEPPRGQEVSPVASPVRSLSPPTPHHPALASEERVTPTQPLTPQASATQAEPAGETNRAVAPKLREKAATSQGPSEAQLLEQARSSLGVDPGAALSRVNEHAARFPRGVLVQEREVIAIQALRQMGRIVEADQRAQAFSKAFPGSAFQRKLKPSPWAGSFALNVSSCSA